MKILLPIYGTEDANLIVDFVSHYLWPPGAEFKVIHVLGSSATDQAALQAEDTANNLVSQVVQRLESLSNAVFTAEICRGGAILEIVTMASKWHADMIVMGYRTIPTMERLISGSVSNGVVMQAPCSVAVIRPPVTLDDGQAKPLNAAIKTN